MREDECRKAVEKLPEKQKNSIFLAFKQGKRLKQVFGEIPAIKKTL